MLSQRFRSFVLLLFIIGTTTAAQTGRSKSPNKVGNSGNGSSEKVGVVEPLQFPHKKSHMLCKASQGKGGVLVQVLFRGRKTGAPPNQPITQAIIVGGNELLAKKTISGEQCEIIINEILSKTEQKGVKTGMEPKIPMNDIKNGGRKYLCWCVHIDEDWTYKDNKGHNWNCECRTAKVKFNGKVKNIQFRWMCTNQGA